MSYLFANEFLICLISLLINHKSIVFAETMDRGRDEDQKNILEDMIRGDDDVDIASSFLNDSGEGMEIEAESSGSRTLITTGSGEVY